MASVSAIAFIALKMPDGPRFCVVTVIFFLTSLSPVVLLCWLIQSHSANDSASPATMFRIILRPSVASMLCTCTTHSDVMKVHDWVVDQITDLFRTTHKVKTQQVARNRSQRCGNIEFPGCSPTCGIESFCGDGTLDAVEVCDDGIPILETGAHRLVE